MDWEEFQIGISFQCFMDEPSKYLKNVGPIKSRYVCSIDTVGENNIKKTPL